MPSPDEQPELLERIAAFLRELGIDEGRAPVVHALLVPDASKPHVRVTAVAAPVGRMKANDSGVQATVPSSGNDPSRPPDSDRAPKSDPTPAHLQSYGGGAEKLRIVDHLGAGGMGEVLRVRDRSLHRTLAMKVLLPAVNADEVLRARFIGEAQVTAQLAHPGIPPVHELGVLDDGRPYFTMKEVHGATLGQVMLEGRDEAAAGRANEQRLLEIFQRVCEAVAYAHARGVVHCDLKPANVMVGAFGEVLVMDWGVARLVAPSRPSETSEPKVSVAEAGLAPEIVAGTPAYMAPEQASLAGEVIGPPADVYALGVMLFEILAGECPYDGTARAIVEKARAGAIPPILRRAGSAVDDALGAIVARAMAPEPGDRYADAKALADDLALWRDGAMRRERALATVKEGQAILPEIEPVLAKAAELRERAADALARLGPDARVEDKEPAWALLDEAAELTQSALLRQVEVEQLLFNALAQAPDLAEAKALIAKMALGRHREAERRRAWDEAARHELVMRAHDTGELRRYLAGTAPLTFYTRPRARVRLHRIVRRARRLVAEPVRDLGETPLVAVELPIGSYLLQLTAEGHAPICYPVVLRRREGWAVSRPGALDVFELPLPRAADVGPGEIVVAAGFADLGGDDLAPGAHRGERVWVDGFVMREHPVTCAELAPFLADPEGAPLRRGVLRDGLEVWRPDWPAVGLSWAGAKAYAAWLAKRTGLPWRLPTEVEWEKAARGVDGRFFPWGDTADPAFAHARTVERSPKTPTPVGAFPADRSPYGVRGMGGNVREWCEDAPGAEAYAAPDGRALAPASAPDAAQRIVRGGSWRQAPEAARVAGRAGLVAAHGYADVGLRLARSL